MSTQTKAKKTPPNKDRFRKQKIFETLQHKRKRESDKVSPFAPTIETIPGVCEVFCPEEKRVRKLRYVKGQPSIYADEQDDSVKDSDAVRIRVMDGYRIVDEKEILLAQYLDECAYNLRNHEDGKVQGDVNALFTEIRPDEEAGKRLEEEGPVVDAKYTVRHMSEEGLRAYLLAMSRNRDEFNSIDNKTPEEIRSHLMSIAEQTPEKFLDSMEDMSFKYKVWIAKSLKYGLLEEDKDTNRLLYTGSKEECVQAPSGMDVVDYFAEAAKENSELNNKVVNLYHSLSKIESDSGVSNKDNKDEVEKMDEHWADTFLKKAAERGVVKQANGSFVVPGKGGGVIGKGDKAEANLLKDKAKLFLQIKEAMEDAKEGDEE